MLILKLGGSVITIKGESMNANDKNIKRLAEEIAAANCRDLVIVHGGGSFGHPIAKKYGIAEGYRSNQQVFGFSQIHRAMITLNSIIIDALLEVSVPSVAVSPSSFIVTDEGRIVDSDFKIIHRLVSHGFVPILFGDAVLDKSKGFCILSGDQIAVRLSTELDASRLVFGVDVDGVYTSNPKLAPESRLVDKLHLDKLFGLIELGKALTTDVTGGMLGKVSEAANAVEAGVEVLIVNASRPGNILKTLRGEPVIGTIITR